VTAMPDILQEFPISADATRVYDAVSQPGRWSGSITAAGPRRTHTTASRATAGRSTSGSCAATSSTASQCRTVSACPC